MTVLQLISAAVVAVVLASPAVAADVKAGPLEVSAPWARATPKGATIGGGYMTITNTGKAADRLIGAAAAVSDKVELHEMSMDKGVMKMRPLPSGVEIKPGQTVNFEPGGLHLMLVGSKQPLTQGQTFKVVLEFESAGKVEVDYSIAGIGAKAPGASGNMPGHMPGMKH